MQYLQNYNPLNNQWASAAVALLPIICFFVCLLVLKLKGHFAGLLTVSVAIVIAIVVYQMPSVLVFTSFLYGFVYGMFPIAWIIIAAIFLYKLNDKSGYFKILRDSIIAITPDQRLQVILIGFCFGAFLEGAIGFGGPVAITAALLVGMGLRPLYAAGLCLIANTAPVAFGAVGIPVIAMAKVVSVPAIEISAVAGKMLPPLSVFVPFFLVFLMNGFKGVKETFPAVLVAGVSFAIVQFYTANYHGPELPDIASAVVSIICTAIFLRFWQPKNIFRFETEDGKEIPAPTQHSLKEIVLAWLPFIILIIAILLWTQDWFKKMVGWGTFSFDFTVLQSIIQVKPVVPVDTPVKSIYELPIIASTGTAIFITALITIPLLKVKSAMAVEAFSETFKEMKWAIVTIGLVVGFAFVCNNSGMSATLATALAKTGNAFAFFSPIVGWLGVFLTGSDTSSNLLFGSLQQLTARQLGIPEVLFLAANTVGGVVGKMISPQSIAIACAAVGLVGKESDLFRFTVKYSIGFVILIGIAVYLAAFVFTGILT
ncbi:L-lactate permease [Helicobacter monodelphidis]|uniref:L-lactate permease n=1 Tax=Helicobacter sp. 15-1451 TaxID=2004995 RepID=UPI000DCD9360|nr:lactate permease LctP family transporter [Helicobacter sp. 15-1451]RAX59356.1 L-lactate permease [Helicobacter sp. 15-1451]